MVIIIIIIIIIIIKNPDYFYIPPASPVSYRPVLVSFSLSGFPTI